MSIRIPASGVTVVLTIRLPSYSVAKVAEKDVPRMIEAIEQMGDAKSERRPIVTGANVKRSTR